MKNYAGKVATAPDDLRRAIVYAAISPGKPLNLGEELSVQDRLLFKFDPVKIALKRLKLVLFIWMVQDFRAKPTKTKALCIFDMFLANSTQKGDNYSRLVGRMDTVRQDSELAKSMSWFKRVSTSGSRKVDSNIFDDMYVIHMIGTDTDPTFRAVHQDQFRQIMSTPATTSLSNELSAAMREIRQNCEAAGFSLRKLGLSDSFA